LNILFLRCFSLTYLVFFFGGGKQLSADTTFRAISTGQVGDQVAFVLQ
jgi:hypothetical protein